MFSSLFYSAALPLLEFFLDDSLRFGESRIKDCIVGGNEGLSRGKAKDLVSCWIHGKLSVVMKPGRNLIGSLVYVWFDMILSATGLVKLVVYVTRLLLSIIISILEVCDFSALLSKVN